LVLNFEEEYKRLSTTKVSISVKSRQIIWYIMII